MDTQSLEIFLEVAQQLSFAKVAEGRAVNASTISRIISSLESELRVKLFTRSTRTMTLTEAGELFALRLRLHLDDLDQTLDMVKSLKEDVQGTLKISASVAFGEVMLVPLISEFRNLYPQLNLELHFTDENTDLLANGFDVAIRLAPTIEKNLVVTKLMSTRYLLCASPEFAKRHPVSGNPSDIHSMSCLQYALPQFQHGWQFRNNTSPEINGYINVNATLKVSSVLSLRSLCIQGAGVAMLADWLVRDELDNRQLVELFPEYQFTATSFDTSAWIVYPDRHYVPQKLRVFIDFLKEKLRQQAR